MPGQRAYVVYILATRKDGPLYVGVTNDLARRLSEHKSGKIAGFTARYNVNRLVYHETYDEPNSAIAREKQLKRWRRAWKDALIEERNPDWHDLTSDIIG
jgi:putative endonuclease